VTKARAALTAAVTLLALVPRMSWQQEKEAEKKPEPQTVTREEVVVVTASRSETSLVDAPATMSVVTAEQIEALPAAGFAGVLRTMPGINVIDTAAGDFYVTSRLATGLAARDQLTLVDGRPFPLNFVGVTLWQLAPLDLDDAKQIEVVQGPASAIWGANALTGVVNVLSWPPREDLGTRLHFSGGLFGRDAGQLAGSDAGTTWSLGVNHARTFGTKWALRVNAGYVDSNAWPRPAGAVPAGHHPLDPSEPTGGAPYPRFQSRGTQQPRVSVRVDQDLEAGGRLIYEGGFTQASGLAHTPVGPFFVNDTRLSFLQARYEAQGLRLRAYGNFLNGENSPNLLTVDAKGEPVRLDFKTNTLDLDGAKTWTIANRHLVSLGADYTRENFDTVSTAPKAEDRNELGGHVHADLRFGQFHVDAALRLDKFSSVKDVIFSPRLALLFKPTASQSVRASFGRSFRAPSATDDYLDLSVVGGAFPLGALDPQFEDQLFPIVVHVRGDTNAKAESLTMWEIGYTGVFGRTTASGAVYLGDLHNPIANVPGRPYTSANPPPGWPLPPFLLDVLAQNGVALPSELVTTNLGPVRNRGLEVGLSHRFSGGVAAFANYSWQDHPEPLDSDPGTPRYPAGALNVPSHDRFNLGLTLDRGRLLGGLTLSYMSEAFWADVLGPPYWGPTPAHTLLGASAGVRLGGTRLTLMLKGMNLLNEDVQYHVFGDIAKRSVVLQASARF
jgi:outer membrane receptor protein involved in Fe transport